ncbi:hypothetical protein [Hoeflea algicola]
MCAMAPTVLAPPKESFEKGRDFSSWVGLTPKQRRSSRAGNGVTAPKG